MCDANDNLVYIEYGQGEGRDALPLPLCRHSTGGTTIIGEYFKVRISKESVSLVRVLIVKKTFDTVIEYAHCTCQEFNKRVGQVKLKIFGIYGMPQLSCVMNIMVTWQRVVFNCMLVKLGKMAPPISEEITVAVRKQVIDYRNFPH